MLECKDMGATAEPLSAVSWQETLCLRPNSETLDMLFAGTIAGLCIPEFMTGEECEALTKRARECEFQDYVDVFPRIEKVGLTVFEFDRIGKRQYFEAVDSANRKIDLITRGVCRPLERVIDWLARVSPNKSVEIAHEPGFGRYFAGLFRRIEEGTLIHVDFAPMEQPGWAVANVCSQLTFNIYLDVPRGDPGVVHVWQKQWQPEHQVFKRFDSYGYEPAAVDNVPVATITPRTGMFMAINTRNFHQVSVAAGGRLAVSAAIGQLPDRNLVLWS
jgi:hypothetical protein